ncbi:MAG: hypothetical protein ABSG19_03890 [Candidatus Aminicenantales bacterium]
MKTSLAEVSRVYRDHLRGDKPAARGDCPTIERLAQCVLADVPGRERTEIVGHAANCAACAAALKDLLDISAETERIADEFKRAAGRGQAGGATGAKPFWGQLTRKPAVAVMAGIFVLAVVTFSVFRLLDRSATRGGPAARILLVSPVDGPLSREGLEFRWDSVAGADHYRVELFDKSLKLIWQSGRVSGNEVRPADGVGKDLNAGETYYWMLTAVKADRSEIKSRLAKFSIKK